MLSETWVLEPVNRNRVILEAYREWSKRPFSWDGACCLAWCGDVARRLIGADPTVALRARYAGEMDSKRVMVEEGWSSIGDAAGSLWAEIAIALARSGDVALVTQDHGEGLGIVCGDRIAIRTQSGMGQVPLGDATRAFRVD